MKKFAYLDAHTRTEYFNVKYKIAKLENRESTAGEKFMNNRMTEPQPSWIFTNSGHQKDWIHQTLMNIHELICKSNYANAMQTV